MLTDEQLENRKKGLGGSDIASILGIPGAYKSRYEVYLDKIGEGDPIEDNIRMMWGNLLEKGISEGYRRITGSMTIEPNNTFYHKLHPYLLANIDGIVVDSEGAWLKGLEIKNVGMDQMGKWRSETGEFKAPDIYLAQMAHYMMVTDLSEWDIIVLFGGNTPYIQTVQRDKDLEEIIIEEGTKFWKNHVEKRIEPPLDYGPRVLEILKSKFPEQTTKEKELPHDYADWAKIYRDSQGVIKDFTPKLKYAKAKLLMGMEDAYRGRLPDGTCVFRRVNKRGAVSIAFSDQVGSFSEEQDAF